VVSVLQNGPSLIGRSGSCRAMEVTTDSELICMTNAKVGAFEIKAGNRSTSLGPRRLNQFAQGSDDVGFAVSVKVGTLRWPNEDFLTPVPGVFPMSTCENQGPKTWISVMTSTPPSGRSWRSPSWIHTTS
jgi:hypothetical protein